MKRRDFLKSLMAVPVIAAVPALAKQVHYESDIHALKNEYINPEWFGVKPDVELKGYHVADDYTGTTFYFDKNSTEADDGGTVIMPTSTAVGRWIRA